MLGKVYDGNELCFTHKECLSTEFMPKRIWKHKVLCKNYTTYDLRCEQDSINLNRHADVMVLAHEDNSDTWQAYWYACIIGIFHVMVRVDHGFCCTGVVGTGTVLDLLTHTNTIPVAGNPRVSATHSHALFRSHHMHLYTLTQ